MEIWKHVMSRSWVFKGVVIVVLAAAVGGETNLLPQRNCTYAVTIETTCAKGAATSDHVSLRFGDARSNDVLVRHLNTKRPRRVYPLQPSLVPLDDVPTTPFQPCTTDEFLVKGQCVESRVCYLYLKLEGKDDWRPGVVHVLVVEPGARGRDSGYFYFRRFLPRKVWHGVDLCEDGVVTPFGVKHKSKVFAQKHKSP
ncbi:hypothetical protein MLD38_017317 [Melastoma candidum]|uniref:Uncharacterized protein n=1 Tax=Melastoma candidum TaxID=119954 RepID=A0ACB9QQ61_9MYRT|nr:hypothetical protein MLD38_017317 [Melastoma candidum]